MTQRLT